MNVVAHIRKYVFGLTQSAFAEMAGTTQSTVSRWEAGEFEPNRKDLERIRGAALERGVAWDDRWFFEPSSPERAA